MKALLVFLFFLSTLMFGFQNCGEVSFVSDRGTENQKGLGDDITPIDDEDDDGIPDGEDDGEDDDDDDDGDDGDDTADDDEGEHKYICILDGPGKSVRLGFLNDQLSPNGRTPQTICMSKSACEDLVSEKFDVKEAARRGFCPDKNPHVIPMSDAELEERLDAI